jgi:succinate-semialdehyde dehydrogenase/glutarate-semialdehyde dehydrogenase
VLILFMADQIVTISPIDGKKYQTFKLFDSMQIQKKLEVAHEAHTKLLNDTTLAMRKKWMRKLGEILEENKEFFAKEITKEMGKPIRESKSEIDKCILTCKFYLENIEKILEPQKIDYPDGHAIIAIEPIGVVFAVMPWNFPFWQLLRHAIPQILLGNSIVFKHSSQVPSCASAIDKLFLDAGFFEGTCVSVFINSSQSEEIIASKYIKAVTLTGSEGAGSSVASLAGKYLKKCVMELGGSDPFIVFDDVVVDDIVDIAADARLRNAGQACTSPKRFIVHSNIYESFVSKLKIRFEQIKVGDPFDEANNMGPLASINAVNDIEILVNDAVKKGAKLVTGGKKIGNSGFYFEPTIITEITKDMKLFHEEAFGPVASVYKFDTLDEAVELANATRFGLSASVWTQNQENAIQVAERLESGNVFVNSVSTSRPELPFGGVKSSGFGRELGEYGVKEFANIKSVFVKR